MKRRKRFNVRERQYRRYFRYTVALDRRSESSEEGVFLSPVLMVPRSFDRHTNFRINRMQHGFHTRLRRDQGPVDRWLEVCSW